MDWAKAKTIIIALLLGVNIFLLVTYVVRENEARRDELTLRENIVTILNNQGVEVENSVLPQDSMEIRPSTIAVQTSAEKVAARLFGEIEVSSQGESTVYSSGRGNIMFLRDSFSLVYEYGEEVADEAAARSVAEEVASKLSVSTSSDAFEISDVESGYTVRIPQVFSGVRIFGSDVEIKISKSGSVIGSGKFIGSGRLKPTQGKTFPASALMVKFAQGVRLRGIDRLKITKINYGYIANTPTRGVAPLVPILDIETDKGSFYVNMTDGSFVEI